MKNPLVSIIITTYNRQEFLCRAINSIFSQTYNNIEIIVVDDCSSDSTEEIISNYSESVLYIRNSENCGMSVSRNKGINYSSGEYVSFLDDDDELLPEKIEKQINYFLKDDKIDVVYCGSIKKYKNIKINKFPKLKGIIFPKVLDSCPNAIHTLLIKKKCLLTVGLFDENLRNYEDFDLWIRLSKKCIFDFVPECLVIYNMHGDQMSILYKKSISAIDLILIKYKDYFYENKKYLHKHLRRQASKCAVNNDYNFFYNYLFMAIKVRPFCFSSYIHLFLAFLSPRIHKKLITTFGVKKINGIVVY